jgi:hypothetical protein
MNEAEPMPDYGAMNKTQARICLPPAEYAIWLEFYEGRIAIGSSVRDAERFAGEYLRECRKREQVVSR